MVSNNPNRNTSPCNTHVKNISTQDTGCQQTTETCQLKWHTKYCEGEKNLLKNHQKRDEEPSRSSWRNGCENTDDKTEPTGLKTIGEIWHTHKDGRHF